MWLHPGNSLSQQKVQWEVQSSHGINLALQKHPLMMFPLVPVEWLLLSAGRWFCADGFVQPEVFPSATFPEGPWARTGGNAASVPLPNPSQGLWMCCVLCSQSAEAFNSPPTNVALD